MDGEREEVEEAMEEVGGGGEEGRERGKVEALSDRKDSMGEGDSGASDSSSHNDEFAYVRLEEIQKEVQCPICLGIIRKTRTVMECLHRFCRECINKSMRLGNNECPACRTHCASRRSLRDDPNFDALISALFPDIDKYEQEQLSFNEEEKTRNKMIQDSITETFRRQPALLGKRNTVKSPAVANVRRSRKRRTGATWHESSADSDDEERQQQQQQEGSIEVDAARDGTPSSEEQSPPLNEKPRRRKKYRQRDGAGNLLDSLNSSPLIAWGRNGVRSRHVNLTSGSNGAKVSRVLRLTKLVQHLRNATQENNELNLNVILVPLKGTNSPKMEKPYVSCEPSVSISHLCHLVSLQTSCRAEDVEIYMKKQSVKNSSGLWILAGEKSVKEVLPFASLKKGELELLYAVKS